VWSGGRDSATILNGQQIVEVGGSATGDTVGLGGWQGVKGTATSTQVQGGIEYAWGGTVSNATVSNGGTEIVDAGGLASSGTLLSGGFEYVWSGGRDSGTIVSGTLTISSGGSATGNTVAQGGTELVLSGGTLNNVTISGGASGTSISSTIVEVNAGGTVGPVTFAGAGTWVVDATTFSGSAAGFGTAGGAIDLSNISSGGAMESYDSNTHILTVTSGGASATFTFDATIGTLNYSNDGHGGLLITDPPATGGGALLMAQNAAGFQSEVGGGAGALVTTPISGEPTTLTKPT
jgi:autotransporter passenger strand-loop-strand repeat protein